MKNNGKAMAKAGKKTFLRLIRTIFGFFPVLMPLVLIGILFNAIVGSIPAVFMQKVIAVVEQNWQSGDWNGCKDEILRYTGILLTLYGLALAASIFYNRKMAEITQGTLKKLREKMFNSMQGFPVKYFAYTSLNAAKSDISARKHVVFTTSVKEAFWLSRSPCIFFITCSVCSRIVVPMTSPVSGERGI